jgi:tetratricopeptide (TPR) repeat protein
LMGQVEASRIHLTRGLSHARSSGAIEFLIRLLVVQSDRQMLDGDFDTAGAGLQEAGRLAATHDLAPLQMVVLNDMGRHMDHQARWVEAKAYYEQALQLAHRLKDRRVEGGLLGNLGGLLHDQGDLQAARAHYEMSLSLAGELGDRRWEGNGRSNLGLLYQDLGLAAEARGEFERALSIAREVGHAQLEYIVLCNLGALLTSEGKLDDAHRHLQQALDAANASGDKRREGQFRGFIALNHARRGDMREARAALDGGEELLVAMADRLSHALLLCDRAEVEVLARRPEDARRAFEQAQRMADQLKCGDESELRRRLQGLALRIDTAD